MAAACCGRRQQAAGDKAAASRRTPRPILRSRGVRIEVVQDPSCIALMTQFIKEHPQLWNEDIGE